MSVFSFQGKEVLLDAGASSGKDKAMQTELFEVDPLSDNRKLYARAAEALDYSQSAVTVQERW